MDEKSVVKRFRVVDHRGHHFYVQEMRGMWGLGRDFQVCKNRRVLYAGRFKSCQDAIVWLLKYLNQEYTSTIYLDM